MSRQAKWAAAILGGAILLAFVMIALRPTPEAVEPQMQEPLVQTVPFGAADGPIMVSATGTVMPRDEVSVGAEVGGRIVYVHPDFREGGRVGAGSVLFRIDPADFRNRVQSAEADVAAQDVAVLQANEEVTIARAELDRFAAREEQRAGMRSTVDDSDYAASILPPARSTSGTSGAQSAADTKPAPSRLATREPQLRSAEAARARAAAQLADARLALRRTSVPAPFAGLVRSENVAVGTLVQPGQVLGSIVRSSEYEVKVSLTEDEAALIPGLLTGSAAIPAVVYADFGDVTWQWTARVVRADTLLDPETRTIDVFLLVNSPLTSGQPVVDDGEERAVPPLLLGSFVRAEITGGSPRPYAVIPVTALRPGNEVWVARDGKLSIIPVEVLQRSDDTATITTPSLAQGGRLVTSSLRTPVEGMSVRFAPAEGSRAAEQAK